MGGLPTPRPGCVVEESPEGLRVIGKDDSSIDYTDQYNKFGSMKRQEPLQNSANPPAITS